MIADDLDVYFDADDFGAECTRVRAEAEDVPFVGIFGLADDESFGSHTMATHFALRYPTAAVDLVPGDGITIGTAGYRVERADLAVDGNESIAILLRRTL